MTLPINQQAYSQSSGTSQIPAFIFENRDPTSNDYNPNFKMYTGWINTVTKAIWYLEAVIPVNGQLTSQWRAVGPIVVSSAPPTSADYQYPIGQTWIDTVAMQYWGLVNVTGTTATWENLSSGVAAGILTITGNTGGSVAGDGARNVNLLGSAGVTVTGTPLTNTLTISLSGGGAAIDSVGVDAHTAPGTNPVLPDASGEIFVTGGQIAAASTANVIQTNSLAANTYSVQVQRSKTEPVSTIGSNGVCHFNSAQFTVDNNGFVSAVGGGPITSVNIQVFTSSGTYTPTPGMKQCIIEVLGGGGGGASSSTDAGHIYSVGSGGDSGGYSRGIFSAATIGVSKAVTIGAGGNAGVGGGTTSVGALIQATGGDPGQTASSSTNLWIGNGAGGSGSGGVFNTTGNDGDNGLIIVTGASAIIISGSGSISMFGGQPTNSVCVPAVLDTSNGQNATGYGSGGSGGASIFGAANATGGKGSGGLVIITEYIG